MTQIDASTEAVERHLNLSHNHEAGLIPVATRSLLTALLAERLEADLCAVVKPLDWEEYYVSNGNRLIATAVTPLVTYRIMQKFFPETFFSIEVVNGVLLSADTVEAAKAAAQADYKRRILSSITIRSASDVAAEARAGAIEAAAGGIVNLPLPYERWSDGQCGAVLVALQKHADSIRALHDTDTLAAIERIKEQARQEERERCVSIAEDFGCCHVPAEIAKAITEPGGGDQPHTTD